MDRGAWWAPVHSITNVRHDWGHTYSTITRLAFIHEQKSICGLKDLENELNGCLYTLLYLKWITNKDLPYSTWNSAQYDMVAWLGGESGVSENVYVWLSPLTVHLKLSPHCSSVIPQYKIKPLKYGEKHASVGAMASSTMCQGIWEESCPPGYQVKGSQIWVSIESDLNSGGENSFNPYWLASGSI